MANMQATYQDTIKVKGKLMVEVRNDFYTCQWQFFNVDNTPLAGRHFSISKRIIPHSCDPFNFALEYTLENIKRFRIGRDKVFKAIECYLETSEP